MSKVKSRPLRVGSLDSLRGIAILLVILAHTASRFDDSALFRNAATLVGNLGVQLFFVVSAYTMCLMWRAREAEHRKLEKFYIRRFCRLAVPYWSAMLFYLLVMDWHPNGIAPLGIISNIIFLHGLSPNFMNSYVPGGWSIADEANFYLIFPLLVQFNPAQLIACGLLWYLGMGLGLESYLKYKNVDGGYLYYSLLTQFPVFTLGMASFELSRRNLYKSKYLYISCILIFLLIAIAFFATHSGHAGRPFLWIEVVMIVITTHLVVHFGINLRILSFIGQRSYSMYLLHFCVLWGLIKVLPVHTPWVIGFAATTLFSVIAATVGQKTVETWGQALGKWLVARLPAEVEPAVHVLGQR